MTALYAILSDIHGNVWALDAVLADIARRGIRTVLNLGDTLYGPLAPAETARRLMQLELISIQGNQDRAITASLPSVSSPTLLQVKQALSAEQIAWLAAQPPTRVVDEDLFLCHGTPLSDGTYLLEDISPRGSSLLSETLIEDQLRSVTQPVVLCGHSHIPRMVRLQNGRLIINPGSVGLPAYNDDLPLHKMETGSPYARYALLWNAGAGWQVEHICLLYDWQSAAMAARKNGREDWAFWLSSGRA
jgi:putative phosphoesterase